MRRQINKSRARRRKDLARMKRKAKRIRPGLHDAEKDANHLAVCSCLMCGNPRRHFRGRERLTIQERRQANEGSE